MTERHVPAEAVEAAHEQLDAMGAYVSPKYVAAALEAALPILLSHESEQTRLAHLDATVNRDSVDKMQRAVDAVAALHFAINEDRRPFCNDCGEPYPCGTVSAIQTTLGGSGDE